MTMTEQEAAEHAARRLSGHYADRLAQIVTGLRDLADDVARNGALRTEWPAGLEPSAPHTYAAQQAVHDLMWGMANLGLSRLVDLAGEADAASRAAKR